MKQARIKELETLERNLLADGYEVKVDLNPVRNKLLFIIKLKSDNDTQILSEWNKARKAGG